MIYTRVLLDDSEVDIICCALNRLVDDSPAGSSLVPAAINLRQQIKDCLSQTQRIRENEKAGVK